MEVRIFKWLIEDGELVATGKCMLTIENTYQAVIYPDGYELICTGWLAEDATPSRLRTYKYTFEKVER